MLQSNSSSWADTSALHLLHRATQRANSMFAGVAHEHGLTVRQLQALITLSRQEGQSQVELGTQLSMDASTIGAVTRLLVKKCLIRRRRDPRDTRRYILKLSVTGRKIVDQADPIAEASNAALIEILGADRSDEFLASLERIIEAQRHEPSAAATPLKDCISDEMPLSPGL